MGIGVDIDVFDNSARNVVWKNVFEGERQDQRSGFRKFKGASNFEVRVEILEHRTRQGRRDS